MPTLITNAFSAADANPLDLMEELAVANDWPFDRSEDELTAAVAGGFCEYHLRLLWRAPERVLQLVCAFDGRVAEPRRPAIYETLARINERLWLGHFEMWCEEGMLLFRHTAIVEEGAAGLGGEHLATLVETALGECERFYPAFQFVVWAGKRPREALESALLDTLGEA